MQAGIFFQQTVNPGGNVTAATVRADFSRVQNGKFTLTLSYLSAMVEGKESFDQSGVLTGFGWNKPADASLSISGPGVVMTGGQTDVVSNDTAKTQQGPADIGAWWAFNNSLPGDSMTGVGATGGDPGDWFGEKELIDSGGGKLNGTDYGLIAPNLGLPNGGNGSKYEAWAQSEDSTRTSVVFTFNVNGDFDPGRDVTSGQFLFGSELEQHDAGEPVPGPSTLAGLLSLASVGGVFAGRRRGSATRQAA